MPERPVGVNTRRRPIILGRLSVGRQERSRARALERVGFVLYGQAVAAARRPVFYLEFAVADTLDGRFDMICLHVALLIHRLAGNAPLAQAVFDAMFSDMDDCLREGGVGDLGVPRRVKAMWEAYHGRAVAYGRALAARDAEELAAALWRNLWRGQGDTGPQAAQLADWALDQHDRLAVQPDSALAAGQACFTEPDASPAASR